MLRHRFRQGPSPSARFRNVLLACVCSLAACRSLAETRPAEVSIHGPGVLPHLTFACCDHAVATAQSLFADRDLVADLIDLHAAIAVPILDFTIERAQLVRQLNQSGIPVVAWMLLPKEEGLYLNADNAPETAARVSAFERWTRENSLKWAAVGLDIEPDVDELRTMAKHRWRLVATLVQRSLSGRRAARARQAYSAIIHDLQSQGYSVQTYQMPFLPAERAAHSTLLDRLLGTVDIQANEEYLMLYTSYARPVGAGMIWSLGPNAQGIAIGSTDGDTPAGSGTGPLDWEEFDRDLIVAAHFTRNIGVYDLEGCIRQGFLPRLKNMNWSDSVTIPAESMARAERFGLILRMVLWSGSHLPYFALAALLLLSWLIGRWRRGRRAKQTAGSGQVPPRGF